MNNSEIDRFLMLLLLLLFLFVRVFACFPFCGWEGAFAAIAAMLETTV